MGWLLLVDATSLSMEDPYFWILMYLHHCVFYLVLFNILTKTISTLQSLQEPLYFLSASHHPQYPTTHFCNTLLHTQPLIEISELYCLSALRFPFNLNDSACLIFCILQACTSLRGQLPRECQSPPPTLN